MSHISRMNLYSTEEKELLCQNMPKEFFKDDLNLLEKHFYQQRKIDVIRTCFLSEPDLANCFCRWNLVLELPYPSIKHTFLNRTINITSFFIFISKFVFFNDAQEKNFFISHRQEIFQISHGDSSLASEDEHTVQFKNYCLHKFLPLPRNAQGCESAIKDTVNCKNTGKD